jgi:hypothetical protein
MDDTVNSYEDDLSTTFNPDSTHQRDEVALSRGGGDNEHETTCQSEHLYLRNGRENSKDKEIMTRAPMLGNIQIPTVPHDLLNDPEASSNNSKTHTTNNNVNCGTYQQIVTGANNANANWGRSLPSTPVQMDPTLRQQHHFFNEYYNQSNLMQHRPSHTELVSTEVLTGRNKAIVNEVVSVNIFPKMKFCEDDDFLTRTEEKNHLSKIIVDSVGRKGVEERKSFWLGYKDVVKNHIRRLRTTTITSMKKRYTDCKSTVDCHPCTNLSMN